MITPYELAYLCGDAYREDSAIRPASYGIDIPGAGNWGVGAHDGVSENFFCTKYIKSGSFENVIAFRGTGARPADIAADAVHLLSRNSSYIDAAKSFMRRYATRETIVTGHSLGGFIAVTMAFHYPTRVVAINPPWVGSFLLDLLTPLSTAGSTARDRDAARRSPNFQASRLIVYQSNTDVVTSATHANRIDEPNINFIRIGAYGWHNLDPIIENFRRDRNYAIRW